MWLFKCVQGSGVLFVPDTPAEGWTGEQVLRISGHGALYVQSHQDYSQVVWNNSAFLLFLAWFPWNIFFKIHFKVAWSWAAVR